MARPVINTNQTFDPSTATPEQLRSELRHLASVLSLCNDQRRGILKLLDRGRIETRIRSKVALLTTQEREVLKEIL